jgi:hypothetical protein
MQFLPSPNLPPARTDYVSFDSPGPTSFRQQQRREESSTSPHGGKLPPPARMAESDTCHFFHLMPG